MSYRSGLGNLVVTGGNVCACNGRDSAFNHSAVGHDGEVRLWATNSVEVEFAEADGLLVRAVEGQAQAECRFFIGKIPVFDGRTINWGIAEWRELQLNVVFAPELLLGGGRSGKQGNKCQGGQDVLHLEVSKSFRAQETQFPRNARNISTSFPQRVALNISLSGKYFNDELYGFARKE